MQNHVLTMWFYHHFHLDINSCQIYRYLPHHMHFLPSFAVKFKRAVKITTGHDLSDNVLDTVFKIFDMDGDNCLSHKEFINVMQDRVLRGLKVNKLNL